MMSLQNTIKTLQFPASCSLLPLFENLIVVAFILIARNDASIDVKESKLVIFISFEQNKIMCMKKILHSD